MIAGLLAGLLSLGVARAAEGDAITVATLNLGLLRIAGRYSVPQAEPRRAAMPAVLGAFLDTEAPEAMLLQECYAARDRALLSSIGREHGYKVVDQRPTLGRTGLLLLVRDELSLQAQGFAPLPNDAYGIAGYRRGLLWATLKLPSGGSLYIGNTHLTPLPEGPSARRRAKQVAALLALAESSPGCSGPRCVRILGGDLNLAPNHTWDWSGRAAPADRARREPWLERDRASYAALRQITDGEAGDLDPGLWTLDARNPLWETYELSWPEPTRRVDLLFVQGAQPTRAARLFAEPAAGDAPLSDHYGLLLTVRPPPTQEQMLP